MSSDTTTALEPPTGRRVRATAGLAAKLRQPPTVALLIPGALLLILVFGYPVVELLSRSFSTDHGAFGYYKDFLGSGPLVNILLRSAWTAFVVTAVSLLIGYPFAYFVTIASTRVRRLLLAIIAISLFISVVARGYAWLVILDRNGALNKGLESVGLESLQGTYVRNFAGVVIGMIQYGIPLMVLPIYDSMRRFDDQLRYAAATLGARPLTTFFRVYLPLTMPGVIAGSAIVFIATLGYYVLPSILGGPGNVMIGQVIADKIQSTQEYELASAMAVILLLVALVFFVAFMRVTRNTRGRVFDV
jgi:putative spermidine/putrescine transport system permease protein